MSTLLAVDPGASHTGSCAASIFHDRRLHAARTFGFLTRDVKHSLEAARLIATDIRSWYAQMLPTEPDELVLEWPQVYRVSKQKGDQKDILALAAVDGAIAARFSRARLAPYRPADWKGQIPKAKRGEDYVIETRVAAALAESTSEDEIFMRLKATHPGSKFHNIVDAIGIGLFHLGRINQPKAFYRG